MEHKAFAKNEPGMRQLDTLVVEPAKMPNALLERLIREVKTEAQSNVLAYNRTHNRHNRGR